MHAYAHTFIHTQKCATFSMDQQRRRRKPSSTEGRGKLPAWVSLRKAQKQAKSRATAFLSPSLKHPNMANLPCPLSHDRETTVAREFFSFRVSPGFVLHSEQNIQTNIQTKNIQYTNEEYTNEDAFGGVTVVTSL